jgi:hypothetical protein
MKKLSTNNPPKLQKATTGTSSTTSFMKNVGNNNEP